MSTIFDADEIFEMAEEIERNAAMFYREAAKSASVKQTKHMFLDMAAMEEDHLKTFTEMRGQFKQEDEEHVIFDPNNEAALYLQAIADSRGWEGQISLAEKLTGREKIEDILQIAINAEKNSIVFFVGLEDFVPARLGKDKVESLIKEEMSHLTELNQALAALK